MGIERRTMPVKASEIKGFIIDKAKEIKHFQIGRILKISSIDKAYNKAIDQQGQVSLGLNRENLTMVIFNLDSEECLLTLNDCKNIADAIISKEHELLEVKND